MPPQPPTPAAGAGVRQRALDAQLALHGAAFRSVPRGATHLSGAFESEVRAAWRGRMLALARAAAQGRTADAALVYLLERAAEAPPLVAVVADGTDPDAVTLRFSSAAAPPADGDALGVAVALAAVSALGLGVSSVAIARAAAPGWPVASGVPLLLGGAVVDLTALAPPGARAHPDGPALWWPRSLKLYAHCAAQRGGPGAAVWARVAAVGRAAAWRAPYASVLAYAAPRAAVVDDGDRPPLWEYAGQGTIDLAVAHGYDVAALGRPRRRRWRDAADAGSRRPTLGALPVPGGVVPRLLASGPTLQDAGGGRADGPPGQLGTVLLEFPHGAEPGLRLPSGTAACLPLPAPSSLVWHDRRAGSKRVPLATHALPPEVPDPTGAPFAALRVLGLVDRADWRATAP